ncbi:MAG: tRNA (N6-threonylcarbamoyladenosine(37)-N6)-methyltransferase TrmO [Candidatus Altiarchaeota archaeon]|nr:tRNA (N6-threonylcarbamoyladenosine(37)-N6)-methyltransferase TrmO [Candidatus Altiarchaeota archaeon]
MENYQYKSIGIIHSKYKKKKGVPIQGVLSKDSKGWMELFPEYKEGLKDLDGFSHIFLIYQFHLSKGYSLLTKPFLEDAEHGIFATRAPKRPNPIGISIVKLEKIEENKLYIDEVDIIDGTPLLDIKPFIPEFDSRDSITVGWIESKLEHKDKHISDDRFD